MNETQMKEEESVKLQACLKDVKSWMSSNVLMNSDKTEVSVWS